jgi:hypothetical protein
MWVDWTAKPDHPGPAAQFFSAANGPALPFSFTLSLGCGHAHDGGARSRWMAVRMARTIGPVTAISAILEILLEPLDLCLRRTSHWLRQPLRDPLAQNVVGRQSDGVEIPRLFQPRIDRRHRIGGVCSV